MTGCDVSTCIYHLSYKTHQYNCDLTSRNKKNTIKETATARHRKKKKKFREERIVSYMKHSE